MNQKKLLTFLFVGISFGLFAQKQMIDSLESRLKLLNDDSLKVKTLNKLVLEYEFQDTTKAWDYCRQSIQLGKTIGYTFGEADALRLAGILSVDRTDYPNGKAYLENSLEVFNRIHTQRAKIGFAIAKHWIGVIQESEGNYKEATISYLEAAKIFEDTNDEKSGFYSYLSLMGIELDQKEYLKAMNYAKECLAIGKRQKNKYFLAHAYLGITTGNIFLKRFAEASHYLDSAKMLAEEMKENRFLGRVYYMKAELFDAQNIGNKAIENYIIAIEYFKKTNNQFQIAGLYQELGECYLKYNKLTESEKYLSKALLIAEKYQLQDIRRVTYRNLSSLSEKKGNYTQSLTYLKKYLVWNDSIQIESNQKQIKSLEAKYQNERKLKMIAQLEKDKINQQILTSRKTTFVYILIAGIVSLLIVGLLIYLNLKSKQRIHHQKITQLQNEKLILASESILKGQENERSRMAQDLHDGLGGMLSSIKLTLSSMKGNIILTEDNARLFTKAFEQLDSSIGEMRRVAHNMMPEALVKLGLQQALQDYCDSINESKQLRVDSQFFGLEKRVESTTEIIIYRIVQELVNNTIKHAHATSLLVQVMKRGEELSITVEDNGTGFDPAEAIPKNSAGLSNIRSRVDYLKGQIDIQSKPGTGTSVHIDCRV
jgi:two-component system, NarL family, sensor kinase